MATSRVASNAARHSAYAARAQAQQVLLAARSAASVGVTALRETARINSYPEPSNVLSAIDNGDGTATIQIADHQRTYPVQGDYDVPDVAIHDVADVIADNSKTYFPYYDDITLADETPVVQLTENPAEAQAGAAPGRHALGIITTPGPGGTGTTGTGGPTPPGWGTDLP